MSFSRNFGKEAAIFAGLSNARGDCFIFYNVFHLDSWVSSASQTIRENLAMLAGMIIFSLLNYFGQKLFAFRDREETP